MTDAGSGDYLELDPGTARTSAEYVTLLRQLRDRSGLTYRQLQQRARAAGEDLPRSTLSAMLSRDSLPREALVTALVRACGGGPDDIARWVAARKRIAFGAVEPAPASPGTPPRKWLVWALIGLVVAGAAIGVTALVVNDEDSPAANAGRTRSPSASQPSQPTASSHPTSSSQPTPANRPANGSALPPPGPYRVRVERSSKCLTEDPGLDNGRVFQANCDASHPPLVLEDRGQGRYRLSVTQPRLAPRCLAVDGGFPAEGDTVSAGACGNRPTEEFRLEPVTEPVRGFRLRPVGNNLCLGVADSMQEWAPLRQDVCYPNEDGQVFTFRPG